MFCTLRLICYVRYDLDVSSAFWGCSCQKDVVAIKYRTSLASFSSFFNYHAVCVSYSKAVMKRKSSPLSHPFLLSVIWNVVSHRSTIRTENIRTSLRSFSAACGKYHCLASSPGRNNSIGIHLFLLLSLTLPPN